MKKHAINKDDLPLEEIHAHRMIDQLLPNKTEKFYSEINANNIAEYLVKVIPKGSIEEI